MLKIFLIFVLGLICTGCASSTANASPVKVSTVEKQDKNGDYGECKMMSNGYLVCPKTASK